MPAAASAGSAMEPLTSSLKATFASIKAKTAGNGIDQSLAATAKKTLLTHVKFDSPKKHVINSMQETKYIVLNPKSKMNGNSNGHVESMDTNSGAKDKEDQPTSPPKPKYVFFNLADVEVGYHTNRCAGAGMQNVGNTCYLNSTLQALFHTPALYNYLMSGSHAKQCKVRQGNHSGFSFNTSGPSCLICAMTATLRDTLNSNGGVIRPNKIYEKLKLICKHMVHGRQEDAHEFLRYLIESLQRTFLHSSNHPQLPSSVPIKSLDSASKETTPFNQIFGGFLRQDVTCLKCKYVSVTFQHFMDLLLDIRQASNLDEAMAFYFRAERLGNPGDGASNMYKCDRCKVKVPAKKKSFIERPPVVLCLQLKRFSLMGGKISKPVQLPRHLEVSQYARKQVGPNPSPALQYKLVSMITHVGPSPNCGHYTAIGEAGNGQFFQFDDSSVRMISPPQALNTASYVVIYEMTKKTKQTWVDSGLNREQVPRTIGPQQSHKPSTVTSNGMIGPSRPSMSDSSSSASSSPMMKPKIASLNGSSSTPNKFGVVNKPSPNKPMTNGHKPSGGLVPYGDDDNDSSSEDEGKVYGPVKLKVNGTNGASSSGNLFLPRSVLVKNGGNSQEPRPATPATLIANTKAFSEASKLAKSNGNGTSGTTINGSSSGAWKVTDAEHHNPSVHSDNSTGSTSSWKVTPTGRDTPTKAANGNGNSNGNGYHESPKTAPPPPQMSSSRTEKILSRSTFEPPPQKSLKRSNSDDYDDEIDRGRTKKVKTNRDYSSSSNGRLGNPFQEQQNNRSSWNGNNSWNGGSRNDSRYGKTYGNNHHRDHSYHAGDHRGFGSSSGGSYYKSNFKRSHSSGSLNNDHYRDKGNRRRDDRRGFHGGNRNRDYQRGYNHNRR